MSPTRNSIRFLVSASAAAMALLLTGVCLPPATAAHTSGRVVRSLNDGWRFHLGDVAGAEQAESDDSGWEPVSVPHTWNGVDGQDGGGYFRGVGWYRLRLRLRAGEAHRRVFLQFDGASLVCDVFVNGRHAGRHEGAFARFRFGVTSLVRADADNVVAVRVDNARHPDVAPLSGDFTLFGGLLRDVSLVAVDPIHIDALDFGGPWVSIRQRRADVERAELEVTARVSSTRSAAEPVVVKVSVLDAVGKVVARAAREELVEAARTVAVAQSLGFSRPRLWNGRADPYLYSVRTEVMGRNDRDAVTLPLGVRTMSVDPEAGVLLNGEPYPLRGVNMHPSSRPGRGPAVTPAEREADLARIAELGATAVRFAHYQHPPEAYDLADRLGLVLWTEAPFVSEATDSPEFQANVLRQMRELIRQNRNHPSVAVWGFGNEQYTSRPAANRVLAALPALAKEEDPDRPTTYAHCCRADDDPLANHADLTGYNRYFQWTARRRWTGSRLGRTPFTRRRRSAVSPYRSTAAAQASCTTIRTAEQRRPRAAFILKSGWPRFTSRAGRRCGGGRSSGALSSG